MLKSGVCINYDSDRKGSKKRKTNFALGYSS